MENSELSFPEASAPLVVHTAFGTYIGQILWPLSVSHWPGSNREAN